MTFSNGSIRSSSPPHGFGDTPRTRVLRARPPAAALAWVERALSARVLGHRALKGGSSSAIHRLRVMPHGADGTVRTVVLRRYVLEELNEEEPDIAACEARALQLLGASHHLVTPAVLAVDETGEHAGVPSLVMSCVPGRLDWFPSDLDRWLHGLVDVLPAVHATALPDAHGLRGFFPYEPERWEPPAWMRQPALWDRAVEMFHGPVLDPQRVLIHRDYHPGNVLWRRGRVSGVVDWQSACVGPPSVDAWTCHGNLLGRFGLETADRFVRMWEAASGETFHPWVAVVMSVDGFDWADKPRDRHDMEAVLARSLAALRG